MENTKLRGSRSVKATERPAFGDTELEVTSDRPGLIVGRTNLPIVNEGDGLFHIARVSQSSDPEATIESLTEQLGEDPLFDEDEII